jgi:D-alanine-D-alanine ligase
VNEEDPLILFLYNVEHKTAYGDPNEMVALEDTVTAATMLIEALRSRGYRVRPIEVEYSLTKLRQALKPYSPQNNFLFTYIDGFRGTNRGAAKVVRFVESLGYKHTGCSADVTSICIDKSVTKRMFMEAGVPTPRFQVFTEPVGEFPYTFPAIVKPLTDDGSLGISLDSVVTNNADLLKQVAHVVKDFGQPALVEEFIIGRELAVSAWGNEHIEVLPVAEQDYAAIENPLSRLLTYEAKWLPDNYYFQNIKSRCPAPLSPEERKSVVDAATRAFRAIGVRDYARADMRFRDGVPYVIEINEVPDLAIDAGFAISAMAAGYKYSDIPERIIKLALKREKWTNLSRVFKSTSPRLQMANASSD